MKATSHAFPSKAGVEIAQGLKVRDYIAIQAMAGLSANPQVVPGASMEDIVKDAYKMADAMIKQSEVRNEQSV